MSDDRLRVPLGVLGWGKQAPVQSVSAPPRDPTFTCPTGKTPYATRERAAQMLRTVQRNNLNPGEAMRVRRCPFCEHFHFGHRRRGG